MYDILFDFSSSPVGGGLRRVEAYAEYFSHSPLKIHFFIHEEARNRNRIQQLVPTTLVHKTSISKLSLSKDYLKKFDASAKWLFSYGIPTTRGYAEKNWLHISNVLPFSLFKATLSPSLFLKMYILRQQYKINFLNNDIISAESNFSIQMYISVTGWKGLYLLLRNGVNVTLPAFESIKQKYAIAVGTHSYKRIDLTYKLFQKLKDDLGLNKLLILGNPAQIPKLIRRALDVEIRDFMPDDELVRTLKTASYFISTSEVENSSCAVQEGLQFTKKAILSNIPSHQEMLQKNAECLTRYKGMDYLIVDQSDLSVESMADWTNEMGKMLMYMGFTDNKVGA
jgi:glycosyltransferase involved in cell wall biosynthesis